MTNSNIGPLMTDREFFDLLRDDIPALSRCSALFAEGKLDEAKIEFYNYIKDNLDREKYFKVIGFDPKCEPDELSRTQAEEALSYNLVSCHVYHRFEDGIVDWYSNHTPNKYEEWTWQLSRHRQVVDLAWTYFYTKDEKYAERAVALLDSWIKQAVVPPIETDGHATLCWRTIECGIRMKVWVLSLVMMLDSPALTPDFLVDFFKSVCEHGDRLRARYTAANWLTIEMNGLYLIALHYPFFKKSDEWREFAKTVFINEANAQTLDDGTHYELTFGYQRVSINCFRDVLQLGEAFGDEFPSEYREKIRMHLHAIIKTMMPSGASPFVNDGWLLSVHDELHAYLELFPDDDIIAWALSKGALGKEPSFKSALLKNAGFVAFRSDWSDNAVMGFFDGGKFGRCHNHEDVIRCHQHEDKLNFLMCIGKKNILAEAQSYAYDTSKMRYHVLSSAAHNTVLVNGEGQNRLVANHWDDSMLHSVEDVTFAERCGVEYATATYDEGYGKNAEIKAIHSRTVYFVKDAENAMPYFIVKDKMSSDESKDFDIVWHYNTEKLKITDLGTFCEELTTLFAGDSGKMSILCGSEEPFAGWISNSFVPGDFSPIPTLYYRVAGKQCEVISAFVPNKKGECAVDKIDYSSGVITVTYKNGKTLVIDY